MKKTMGTVGKVTKSTLLIQPIRILIILNSIFLPLLLGILIFIILKYAQDIEDIIDKAKKIEGMVEDNIKLGINKIKEIYAGTSDAVEMAQGQFTAENTKTFINDNLLTPILKYIDPTITLTNEILDPIKTKLNDIPDMNFTSILDVSGHSINDIILFIKPELITQGFQEALINKVLSEDRSIAYLLTHEIMNGGGQI
tara:strand:- start:102 stop:695 length:594 start_codon:yes stop_codon:yes gene_type:complete